MTSRDSWFGVAVNRQLLAPKDVQASHEGTCQCACTAKRVCGKVFLRWQTLELDEAPENEPPETVLCQAVGMYACNKDWRH